MIDEYDGSELMLVGLLRYVPTSQKLLYAIYLLERNVDKHSFGL